MDTISPFGISSVMSCSAVTRRRPSKCLLTCSRTMNEGPRRDCVKRFTKCQTRFTGGKAGVLRTLRCACGPSRAPAPASRPCSRRSPSPRDPSQQAAPRWSSISQSIDMLVRPIFVVPIQISMRSPGFTGRMKSHSARARISPGKPVMRKIACELAPVRPPRFFHVREVHGVVHVAEQIAIAETRLKLMAKSECGHGVVPDRWISVV